MPPPDDDDALRAVSHGLSAQQRAGRPSARASTRSSSALSEAARAYAEPASRRQAARLDVEVVEDLDVVGEKADGREDDARVAPRARRVERRRQVRARATRRVPPIPWLWNATTCGRAGAERPHRWRRRAARTSRSYGIARASTTACGRLCAVMTTVVRPRP